MSSSLKHSPLFIGFIFNTFFFSVPGSATELETREPATEASSQDQTQFKQIQNAFAAGDHEKLLSQCERFLKEFPKSALIPQAHNLKGLGLLLSHRPEEAVESFQQALETSKSFSFKQFVLYNLAASKFEQGQLDEAQTTLNDIQSQALDLDNRIKYHALRSKVFLKTGLHPEAAREIFSISKILPANQMELKNKAHYAQLLDQHSNKLITPPL